MQRVKYATRFLFVFATMRDTLREFLIVIAAVAKVSCKHGLWLVARVKKRAHIFVFDMCSLFSLSMLYSIFNFLSASLFATVYLLHGY